MVGLCVPARALDDVGMRPVAGAAILTCDELPLPVTLLLLLPTLAVEDSVALGGVRGSLFGECDRPAGTDTACGVGLEGVDALLEAALVVLGTKEVEISAKGFLTTERRRIIPRIEAWIALAARSSLVRCSSSSVPSVVVVAVVCVACKSATAGGAGGAELRAGVALMMPAWAGRLKAAVVDERCGVGAGMERAGVASALV